MFASPFHGLGSSFDGEEEEEEGRVQCETPGQLEAVSSAIRLATEGMALLEENREREEQAQTHTQGYIQGHTQGHTQTQGHVREHVSRVDRVRARRGAFRWLPVRCSNDIEHASWWVLCCAML
jgi:hypothetical protein